MKPSTLLALSSTLAAAALGLTASAHERDHDDTYKDRKIVSVAFGAGLNTAQPGNPENHHVIPPVIRVDVGDVVNFVVAGFHVLRVYDDGVRLRDVKLQLPDECEVNPLPPATFPETCNFTPTVPIIPTYDLAVYYLGLNPLEPPAGPPFAQASTAVNRVEPVSFLKPGRYLVICAVLPHFNDGMIAWVEVGDDRDRYGSGRDHDDHYRGDRD